MKKKLGTLFIICLSISVVLAGEEWFRLYEQGVEAIQNKKYNVAVEKLKHAMAEKSTDTKKIRTYGLHFIEYYPNRELGIAYYYLGNKELAERYLRLSSQMEPSARCNEFLSKINNGKMPEPVTVKTPEQPKTETPPESKMIVGKQTIKLVGERMGVAVLPFENKGASRDLGDIVLDKMITALVNQGRFKVIERAQLEKILQEQQLGQSGVIDASTAAQIGKGIGVDAIIMGSVAATPSGAISLDSRVIDTESATIIVAHDAYSGSADVQSVKNTVENLANKITESLPLVEGFVIRLDSDGTVILDSGRLAGLKRGMKCVVYKEGAELKHPITGEILGRETKIIGEVLITEVFDKYSSAKVIKTESGNQISVGDKFLTK